MSPFGFEPILDSWLAVGVILAGLIALLTIGPQFGALSRRRKLTLIVLRSAAIALLALGLIRPTWVHELKTPRRPVLILMLDISRSMQLPAGQGEQKRWDIEKAAIEKAKPALGRLAADMDLKVYTYDGALHPLDVSAGNFTLPSEPTGDQTDVGTPLAEAIRAEQGKRIAGVILIGDGVQTAFDPQIESQEAARRLRDEFGAPLFASTIGPSADVAQARDIAVDRLDQQFTVFVKNELTVKTLIRIRGYAKKDVPVKLLLGKDEIGATKIRADSDGQQVEATFHYVPQKTGDYRLTVVAGSSDFDELVTKNNRMDAYLTVLEGGIRVLYLEGAQREEFKFIKRALDASPDIELDTRMIDKRGRNRWPVDVGDDFTSGKYDAYLLGDLDSAALGPANLTALAQAVGKGKGLLTLGGIRSYGRGKYHLSPLADAFPIVTDKLEGAEFGARDPDEFFLNGPVPMTPTEPHSITRLGGEADNGAVWKQLPPLKYAYKFAGVKEAPGVRVLLETPGHQPLLVSGEYGRGRVLAFAGESTFLWQMHGKETQHKRFWRQLILWLVRRDADDKSDVWVKLDQRRFQPGGRVQITAGTRTALGDPIPDAILETTLVHPDGRREPLRLSAEKQQFAGAHTVEAPGDYRVETRALVAGKEIGSARAEFMVFDRDLELSNPAADPDHFAALAAWTKEYGGRTAAPEELPSLIDELHRRPQEFEVRQTRWRLAGTPGEAWLFLLLLAGVLSGEWFLRKKWGLV